MENFKLKARSSSLSSEKGASIVEYVLLLVCISIAALFACRALGITLQESINDDIEEITISGGGSYSTMSGATNEVNGPGTFVSIGD